LGCNTAPHPRLPAPWHHQPVRHARRQGRYGDRRVPSAPPREFRSFLETIDAAVPGQLELHLILDNYGTHKTPASKRWRLRHPRFHLHFTPTGGSWLNLVERWFALLTEKQLRRGLHRSTAALQDAIRAYLEHHNRNPKPFIYTNR
jgi:transposase